MRTHLLILLFLGSALTTAQCSISVNGPYSYCDENAEWYVWMTVSTTGVDSLYDIPAFGFSGIYDHLDTVRLGPISGQDNFTFSVVDDANSDCVREVTASYLECFDNPCDLFSLNVTAGSGEGGCSEMVVTYVGEPVLLTLLDAERRLLDTVQVTSQPEVRFVDLAAGSYEVEAIDAEGCTIIVQFTVAPSADFTVELVSMGDYCAGEELTVSAVVAPAETMGLRYAWSTGDTTSTVVLVDPAGDTYGVTVTDPLGCSAVEYYNSFVDFTVQGVGLPDTSFVACGADAVLLAVDQTLEVPTNTFTWFKPQSSSQGGPRINASFAGSYRVSGRSTSGCTFRDTTYVVNPNLSNPINLESFGPDTLCFGQECLGLFGLEGVDQTDLEITWTGPPAFIPREDTLLITSICTEHPGLYTATVRTSCDTLSFSYEVGPLSCGELSGHLWLDDAGNCALDAEDTPVPGLLLRLTNEDTGGFYYTATDANGAWTISVPEGPYRIEPVVQEGQPFSQCPDPTRVTLGSFPLGGLNVYLPVLTGCPQLRTSVVIPFLRRCFQNVAYVEYENIGSTTATDAVLTVTLDAFMIDATPSVPAASQDGQTFTFDLGDLPPFTAGRIDFSFTLSCDARLGQSHCIEAAIIPDEPCQPEGNWSGALVDIPEATCDGDSVRFQIANIGRERMTVPLSYVIVEDGVMLRATPEVNGLLEAGETKELAFLAEGSAYLVVTNQEPNAPGAAEPSAAVEACGTTANGEVFLGFQNLWALQPGNLARSVACRENVGAYDPNDKTAYPRGYGGGEIPPGTRLTYDIRFQNTGTDTAFTVVIRDTLEPTLDLATFKPEGASHPYTFTLDTNRVVTFTFANILLPDSSVNLAASQGVVQFSIDHDSTLLRGSYVDNRAAIFFDFNEPIITNVSRRRIAKEGLPVSTLAPVSALRDLRTYPNPSAGRLRISLPDHEVRRAASLRIMDVYGRPLLRRPFAATLDVSGLPAGYYYLLVEDATGRAWGRAGFVRR